MNRRNFFRSVFILPLLAFFKKIPVNNDMVTYEEMSRRFDNLSFLPARIDQKRQARMDSQIMKMLYDMPPQSIPEITSTKNTIHFTGDPMMSYYIQIESPS